MSKQCQRGSSSLIDAPVGGIIENKRGYQLKLTKLLEDSSILLSAFVLSSCMGAMMLGTDNHEHQNGSPSTTETTLEKEVTVGDMKAAAVFPALEMKKEAVFILKLSNATTGEPLRRAKVYSHVEFEHSADGHHDMNHMAMEDTSRAMKKEEQHGIEFQQEVDESSTPGTYSFSLKPHQSGIHTITFHVTEVDGQILSPALVIEAKRNVVEEGEQHHGGMMGMGSSTTYVVIGAAAMAAMMLTMWLVRGTVF